MGFSNSMLPFMSEKSVRSEAEMRFGDAVSRVPLDCLELECEEDWNDWYFGFRCGETYRLWAFPSPRCSGFLELAEPARGCGFLNVPEEVFKDWKNARLAQVLVWKNRIYRLVTDADFNRHFVHENFLLKSQIVRHVCGRKMQSCRPELVENPRTHETFIGWAFYENDDDKMLWSAFFRLDKMKWVRDDICWESLDYLRTPITEKAVAYARAEVFYQPLENGDFQLKFTAKRQ